MPQYRVTLSDGRKIVVEAAAPPTEAQILASLQQDTPSLPESVAPETAQPEPSVFSRMGAAADRAVEALPTAMATGMGLLGGGRSNPVGMVLAGLGGAGGEGIRQTVNAIQGDWDQVPVNLTEQVKAMGAEGAKQAAFEGAGRALVGPAMQWLGSGIYRSALKPSVAVRAEFPNVTQTLVKEGVPITRSGAGADKAATLVKESGQEVMNVLQRAQAAGAKPVTMRPVAKSLERTREMVSDQAIREADLQKVDKVRNALLKENPQAVDLPRAQAMKQAEQRRAVAAYQKQARGAPVNEVRLSTREDIARGLREAIERRVPDVGPMNKRTQELIGALKAVSAAEGRIANNNMVGMGDALALGSGALGFSTMGPKGAAIGIVQEVLTRPEIASRLGITLDRAGQPIITAQALRAISEAVNQLQLSAEETAEGQ